MKKLPRLVGVVHLPPLPGAPRHGEPMRAILESVRRDAKALKGAGYDLAVVENFGDAPFFRGDVPPVTVAAMTAAALTVREVGLEIVVNVLRNDAAAALSIAHVVDAYAIRVNVHSGARVTDQGVVEGRAAETLRLRRALGAAVRLWADVDVKHSAPLAPRDLAEEAEEVVGRGLADAVLVTGVATGARAPLTKLEAVRRAVPETPLYVASGARADELAELARVADGVVVGSALRRGGKAGGPVDETAARAFAKAFRKAFPSS